MLAAVKLSVLMCLTAISLAEHHRPCNSPNMTGLLSVTDMRVSNTVGTYTYDAVANKLRFKSLSTYSFNSVNLDALFFFNEGVFYEIDGKNQSCEKKSLQSSIHIMEVPSDAEFLANMTLGSAAIAEERLKLSIWKGSIPGTKEQYVMSLTVGCLPVSVTYQSEALRIFSNMEIETEVKDPDLLVVPSFCEGVALEDTPERKVSSFFSLFF